MAADNISPLKLSVEVRNLEPGETPQRSELFLCGPVKHDMIPLYSRGFLDSFISKKKMWKKDRLLSYLYFSN